MHNDHVLVREIGSTTATRLMTLARQLAVEYGTSSDPHLVAQAPEFADALNSEVREQCRVSEQGFFVLRGLSVEDTEIGPTPSRWSQSVPGTYCGLGYRDASAGLGDGPGVRLGRSARGKAGARYRALARVGTGADRSQ